MTGLQQRADAGKLLTDAGQVIAERPQYILLFAGIGLFDGGLQVGGFFGNHDNLHYMPTLAGCD